MSFQFKSFFIDDSQCAMKVGTDGIMLGAWCQLALEQPNASYQVLDIGAGSGLVSLMLAQRLASQRRSFTVTALEIDKYAAKQAELNSQNSPWHNHIKVELIDAKQFTSPDGFDLIVSNPPFFELGQSIAQITDDQRLKARQQSELNFQQLAQLVARLLNSEGTFELVLPFSQANVFESAARAVGLQLIVQLNVKANSKKAYKRCLMRFTKGKGSESKKTLVEELIIHQTDGQYSEDYKRLCKDFYLAF
ncbi:methyltransferase [Catenovulum sp. SM1970]|uniref:tRNA1(Val) (adenine(37)-N6)-methyltransferase n=1 Tax=Marinifaba aquimaris TaxID=2741323 RepID=UPI001572A879|nr:methyltransferase [Marinifaba aquimaris]NTS78097.1 methyltransferase [Marinifaba aquimaris]